MKKFAIPALILLILLNAAHFVPDAQPYAFEISIAAIAIAVAILIAAITKACPASTASAPAVEALKPAPATAAPTKNQAEAEIITLLGMFQEKGRFIDFLMNDITPYSDEQVGSVVRAVHQGCKAALEEHFSIAPVATEEEGADITVPAGYPADEFRLIGNLSGQAPFTGKLVHKGWKVNSIKLPRVLNVAEGRLPALAPAQVEIK